MMTDRQKIAHLLRRFGLGVIPEELDALEKLGVDGAFKFLIEYESTDEGFDISPWELCWEEGLPDIYIDPYRSAGWWTLRMIMTARPMQEKMTLFWHNHFAMSGEKVEAGPMLVQYLDILRKHGLGKFDELLARVSFCPAMLVWLDAAQNQKGTPNENFAREVMELFTMGIGNYTEKDVQEAARAFTGWSVRLLVLEPGADKFQKNAKDFVAAGKPLFTNAYSPEVHDDGTKTILGETKNWNSQDVLTMLAGRPETARYLAKKLWSFFAYENPEPEVIERLAKVYMSSGHQIKPMLVEIYKSPEFWSEKCVRKQVKSPVDFTYTIGRQLGIGYFLKTLRTKDASPMKLIGKPFRDIAGAMFGLSLQQGMMILFPPDVSGWKWGTNWISSEAMLKRSSLGPLIMGSDSKDYGGANALIARMVAKGKPADAAEMTDRFLSVFDGELPPEKRAILVKVCEDGGGPKCLSSGKDAAPVFAEMCKLLFSSPEFQFC